MAASSGVSGNVPSATAAKTMYLLSVAEAAARWSVSSRSVWRWISAGEIKTVKLGRAVRIPVSEVERIARQGVAQ